jgi:NAD(P)-dependent dehydrogenase (short-subunit alcohol dehydrogenase family)
MRTWFITGVSRGLGAALAGAVLARGDTVIGTTRGDKPDLPVGDGTLHVLTLDVADPTAVQAAVDRAVMLAKRVDVVVNNAGYGLLGAVEAATDEEVERLFAVNVFGPFRVIRAFLPHLRTQRLGHVVNITSIAGRAPMASSGLYAAAKSAMEGLSQSLAQELAPPGIKVTAVAPGGFRTDFLDPHSIRRSQGVLADIYAGTVGKALDHLDDIAGRQIGDPARAADAIIAAVEADHPPLHLLLGSDALRRARAKAAAVAAEMALWESTTIGTDFPDGDHA